VLLQTEPSRRSQRLPPTPLRSRARARTPQLGRHRRAVTRRDLCQSGLSFSNPGHGLLCQVSSIFLSHSPLFFSQPRPLLFPRFGYTPEVRCRHPPPYSTLADSHRFYLRETSLTRTAHLIRKWSSIYPYLVKSSCIQSIHKGHDVVSRGPINTDGVVYRYISSINVRQASSRVKAKER
jgi:hypothetical protein